MVILNEPLFVLIMHGISIVVYQVVKYYFLDNPSSS